MKYLLKIVFWLLTLIPAFLTATTPIRTLAQQQQQQKKKKAGKLLFLGSGEFGSL